MDARQEILARTEWFRNARFGMFIHWGLYSVAARGEWYRSVCEVPDEAYETYFRRFCPKQYDVRAWAKLARRAGMKYAVLTAKHHDGFCLFDSKYTDFKSTRTPLGRDVVRDFVEAFRAEGIRVGLYYSLLDWHHEGYPARGDAFHPLRNVAAAEKERDFSSYLNYMLGQIEELVTGYGKLDVMWFDFSYGDMRGEKWRAADVVRLVRKHQPDILLDNRLEVSGEGFGSIVTDAPSPYCGDFVSPEQIIPPAPLTDESGRPVPWEACVTMNDHWGYHSFDKNYKSEKLLLRTLVDCVSKGGNLLLNVGPDGNGAIPPESTKRLERIGDWLGRNGDSVYGAGVSTLPRPEYGRFTERGNKLYVHVFEETIGPVPVPGIRDRKIAFIRLLADGAELAPVSCFTTVNYGDLTFLALGESAECSYRLPDELDTVIEIEFSPEEKSVGGKTNG